MDRDAFDVETVSSTARRANLRSLASAAARRKQWVIAALGIEKAPLKGLTCRDLAAATGEKERTVYFTLRQYFVPSPASLETMGLNIAHAV